jgi:D-alanyl-D-alanine carboxypeptidase/D-alanyl-D-alanine-endopeptidase (penicillin-binding protein 4)
MKKFVYSLFVFLIYSQSQASTFQSAVNSIIDRVDPSINMSMLVVDLNTGEQLFSRNADRALIPASNMKLFSEAVALMALGPDYRFQRQLSTDATMLENGTLHGSIYLSLPGDPSFTSHHLKDLLAALNSWGIKRITGNVVLVNKNASIDPYPPGRDPRDITQGYGAPITPIIIDENRLTMIINPGQKPQ